MRIRVQGKGVRRGYEAGGAIEERWGAYELVEDVGLEIEGKTAV